MVAEKLEVSSYAVKWWYYRRGFPRVVVVLDIVAASRGALTIEEVILSIAPIPGKKKGKRRVKRS